MIKLNRVSVKVGDFSLKNISLEVAKGEYGVLMGKSGSGKTTLIEAACGLRSVHDGKILLSEKDVTKLPPKERDIGFVPQEICLFATKTVRKHLSLGPSFHGWNRSEIDDRVGELASALQIEHLLDRKPHGLSGGERQRVAIGRAIASRPKVLFLDEALNALDEATQEDTAMLIRQVVKQHEVTVLHVTHSRREAERFGDCIIEMSDLV